MAHGAFELRRAQVKRRVKVLVRRDTTPFRLERVDVRDQESRVPLKMGTGESPAISNGVLVTGLKITDGADE